MASTKTSRKCLARNENEFTWCRPPGPGSEATKCHGKYMLWATCGSFVTLKKTWLDGTPFDYANWRQGQPNKGTDQIYARLFGVEDKEKYGTWDSVADFSYNYYPVCMMDAISGPINPPPPDATVPSHDLSKLNCDPNWHYDIAKESCLYLDTQDRAFDAAEANCQGWFPQL